MNNSYSYPVGYSGSNYSFYPNYSNQNIKSGNDDRLIGAGFAFPFLLGGVTGAAIAPAFWRPPYNRPYGPYYGPYYGPGPFYRPF